MKKFIILCLLGMAIATPQSSQAVTLSEVVTKIEQLQRDVEDLRMRFMGQASGAALVGGLATPLRRGSTGVEVTELQNFLSERGFYTGLVDGVFGMSTLNALNAYKASLGFSSFGSSFGGSWRVIGDPVTTYVVSSSACKADFDGNGRVQIADYILLEEKLGTVPSPDQIMFDIKVDGIIDKYDIREWMTHYGKTNFCFNAQASTEAQWIASTAGNVVNPPAPSAVPANSNWSAETLGIAEEDAWLWDYQVVRVTRHARRQVPVTVGGVSSGNGFVSVIEPVQNSPVTLLAHQFAGMYDRVENNNGTLFLVQEATYISPNGRQHDTVRKFELKKPTASENQTTSIDMIYTKSDTGIEGTIYINKRPISSYNGVFPRFFNFFTTDAKWMMTMRVLNDGPIENTSVLGVNDNAPEAAFTFETIADPRLASINIMQGSSTFNPTTPQGYYNPDTNTITLKPNQGQVVWFKLFQKPPSVFPIGFSGMSETKTFGTDFAINLQRNTAVIQNGDFVSLQEQGL